MATYENPYPTSNDAPLSGSRAGMPETDYGSNSPPPSEARVDRVVKGAHDAVDRIAAKAAPALDAMHAHADQLSAMQEEWMNTARTTVREHPLAAIGAAVVFGMLIARLAR